MHPYLGRSLCHGLGGGGGPALLTEALAGDARRVLVARPVGRLAVHGASLEIA